MERDYEKLNKILDTLQKYIEGIIPALYLEGKRVEFTRWRWDEPEIMIIWQDDEIGKNVIASILDSGRVVRSECNAWKDIDRKDVRIRKWVHKEMENVETSDLEKIKIKLREAFNTVIKWTEESLTQTDMISKALMKQQSEFSNKEAERLDDINS